MDKNRNQNSCEGKPKRRFFFGFGGSENCWSHGSHLKSGCRVRVREAMVRITAPCRRQNRILDLQVTNEACSETQGLVVIEEKRIGLMVLIQSTLESFETLVL